MDLMKRSSDMLRGPKKSWDLAMMQSAGDESGVWDNDASDVDLTPDQIGGFVRIFDDEMRVRGMNLVLVLLKRKISERDSVFLSQCVLTVVRLSLESAFGSVRTAFGQIVALLRQAALPHVLLPHEPAVVTRWVKPALLPKIQQPSDDEESVSEDQGLTERLLRSIDVMEGRIPHVIVALAWHPTFLEKWYRTMMHLMRGSGPLPFPWRRYISIVACARFQCMPMLKLQENDFLTSGGDSEWITQGLKAPSMPAKLLALMKLNGLLAHQPWRITASDMSELLSSAATDAGWSVGELVHAIAIMVTFHSICGVVWGLGITPEIDISETFVTALEATPSLPAMALLDEEHTGDTSQILSMLKTGEASFSKQRLTWAQSGEETKSNIWAGAEEDASNVTKIITKQNSEDESSLAYCRRYIGPWEMEYHDFDVASNPIFYKAQYNWENDGYALVHQVLDGLAPLLGAELQHMMSLTYHSFARVDGELDTTAFREAVWHYSHRIKGLLDDDYNYSEVNQLLTRQMKFYIKKVTCFPQTVNMTDFVNLSFDLLPSEKCHIALLATEASKEASLSYALKALNKYLHRK